jgi:hypothetical protein
MWRSPNAPQQLNNRRIPPAAVDARNRKMKCAPTATDDERLLGAGDGGVEQLALEKHVVRIMERKDKDSCGNCLKISSTD